MTDSSAAAPRVLVVEDEYLIRMLLEDMLDELGYESSRGCRHDFGSPPDRRQRRVQRRDS